MEKRHSLYRSILGDDYSVTTLAPEDHDLDQNTYGTDALLTPEDATLADDTEDNVALSALLNDLSPGEASRVLETMRPLSHDENEIVDETPGLKGLRRVDDAENQQWLNDHSRQGYRGMDTILDDASYGEDMNKEEMLERQGLDTDANGSDLGWGIPGISSLKKVARRAYRYGKKGITAPLSITKRLGRAALRFIPRRDAGKAKVVRKLYNKLVVEHANWLAINDQKSGRPVRNLSYYRNASKPWAKAQIARGGLPTKFAVSGADVLGADILGGELVGSWWNPLSWFMEKSQVIVNQTQGSRSPVGPDGQPVDESQMPYPEDTAEPTAEADVPPEGYADETYAQGDVTTGIAGEDSLGAFSTEILSGPVAKRSTSKDDELVEIAAIKLRGGRPLSAGELAVLATLAKNGHSRARRIYSVLLKHGASVSGDDSGAWMHKLNPSYWFKSSQEKKLKDIEVDQWKENARLREALEKRQKALAQAERAKTAKEAVDVAKAQAAATEAQLKAIEASLSGILLPSADQSGAFDSFMGHEKPTPIAAVVQTALAKAGLLPRAKSLYAKISSGKPLDSAELKDAKKIAGILHRTKVVHGDLYKETPYYLSELHGAFVGAALCGNLEKALHRCARCRRAADALSKTISSGRPLTPREKKGAVALAQETKNLQKLVHSHVKPGSYDGLDKQKDLETSAVVGAAKAAMTPAEKKMLSAIVKLAKAGNPRAQRSLDNLRKSGAVVGGDHVGLSISSAFKYATAPIWMPAKHIAKAAKWTGRKLGIVKSSRSPEDARLDRLRAAAKRRAAAEARARAADAQTAAEMRAQQSIAAAADAEAEAADAEALSKEAAMRTREIEADPTQAAPADEEDSSGSFVGSWSSEVGDAKGKKVLTKATEKSATGAKIRAGARLYTKAKRGDKASQKAIAVMVAKAKKGDPQATADVRAVQAGRLAVLARRKAQKKEARKLAKLARKKKVIAVQRKIEVAVANKLVRAERRRQIKKLSKVERLSASGNKKARAYVQNQVAQAKKGNPKAKQRVGLMKLSRKARVAAPTKRERRNLVQAGKLYKQAVVKRNPKAVRRIQIIEAAAKAGNPNAKRAIKRLQLAKSLETAAAAGTVAALVRRRTKGKPSKKQPPAVEVTRAKSKLAAGTATREELAAGARAAQALGDKKTTAALALAASTAPSATETLQKTAAAVTAKDAGNQPAKQAMLSDLEASKTGDPDAIRRTANVVAVNTIEDLKQGKPVPPAMRDAVNLQERAASGDPIAREEVQRITEAATSPNPPSEATAAAVTLAAAAITAKAMASKPRARAEFLEKVNAVPPEARPAAEAELANLNKKADDGTITPEEGARGVRLAERLGKPKTAMNIAAKAPPLDVEDPRSSLPEIPQAPITGPVSLFVESLRALTLSTRDPFANWREGVASRSRSAVPADSSGWSPFAFFRKHPLVAPGTALAASAASFLTSLSARKGSPAPAAPASAPRTSPTAPTAPTTPAAPAPDTNQPTSSGAEKTLRDYVADALKTKKMSRSDFNRAVEVHAGPSAPKSKKETIGKTLLEFLTPRGVKIVP